MAKTKAGFSPHMTSFEKIAGFLILALHIFALPPLLRWLPGILGAELSPGQINLIYYSISLALTAIFLFYFLKRSFRAFFDHFTNTVGAIVLGFVLYYVLLYFVSVIMNLILGHSALPDFVSINSMAKLNPETLAVISLLLAPVVEEALFRGVAFGTIRVKSRVGAYIVSFLLFALYHIFWSAVSGFEWQILLSLPYYLPASLILCWCMERSGSVWSSMVLHCLINCVSLFLTALG